MSEEENHEEEWRTIPGYDDRYEVSDMGRARSWVRRGRNVARSVVPHILTQTRNTGGYLQIYIIRSGGASVCVNVYKLVLAAFVGPRCPGMVCRHLDGNRENNTLGNLAYGTQHDNQMDAIFNEVRTGGRRIKSHKLHPEQVSQIRIRFAAGETTRSLGKEFGVAASTICMAVSGVTWSYIPTLCPHCGKVVFGVNEPCAASLGASGIGGSH